LQERDRYGFPTIARSRARRARRGRGKDGWRHHHPCDKILFGKWSGTEVKLDGKDLLIMKESDILGIVG
jgi:co-chaperonin GroES (HSP10)